jgi:adenomatosis polyposis coli protein
VLDPTKTSVLAARKQRGATAVTIPYMQTAVAVENEDLGIVCPLTGRRDAEFQLKEEEPIDHDRANGDLHCARQPYHNVDEDSHKTNSFRKVEEPYNVDDDYTTETDLDQPTNYSLKFSEHVSVAVSNSKRTSSTPPPPSLLLLPPPPPLSRDTLPAQTPLMFSRHSSMDSMSMCDEPLDDQVSVVSEYSRAVSGIVSPSDLPDSPTQTVPPTPRTLTHDKANNVFHGGNNSRFPASPPARDMFEDEVTVFKDECTPIQFSTATSLSSLNFDDETFVVEKPETSSSGGNTIATIIAPVEDDKDDSLEVDLSLEEQQAIVEACIVSGKPSNVSKSASSHNKVVSTGSRSTFPSTSLTDSTVNYCTEDTPISISHAASNSDLSLLCPSEDSFLQNSILPLSSCLDSVVLSTDEQEDLLNMCIAKGKQSLSYSNANSLDDNKSSQSSTLSEITDDLPIEDRTLIKDMTANANLISSMTTASSITDNDYLLEDVDSRDLSEEEEKSRLWLNCTVAKLGNIVTKYIFCLFRRFAESVYRVGNA